MEKFKPELKPGEIKFLEKFEQIHKERPTSPEEVNKKVILTIEKIKEEIENLSEIKREQEFHHGISINDSTNILAQAIHLALTEGVEKGLEFIRKTNNPYLIDAFHDLLVAHFVDLIIKQK
jgi:hypothetical protein